MKTSTFRITLSCLLATVLVSCGQQVRRVQSSANYSNSSNAASANYVEKNQLADIFANRDDDDSIEISGSAMQEASLKLTNGVNQTFADAGLSASDDEVSDIVNLLLSVFVSLSSGDISSLMDVLNRAISMIVGIVSSGDAQFALNEADNDIIGDIVSILLNSLAALMSGDVNEFVEVMNEFVANLVGGLR